jgi:preprotein translocase subunit SecF
MGNRTLGIVLVVVGVLIVIAMIFAHQLGLSSSPAMFSTKKDIGYVVGVVVFVAGLLLAFGRGAAAKK